MHFSLLSIVMQLLASVFWISVVVSVILLVVNSHKSRQSSERVEALLREISAKLDRER